MNRVEVKFYDSNCLHGWEGETRDFLAVASVLGYVKSENDIQLTLVMAYSDLGSKFNKLTIPKAAIISMTELRAR